MPATVSTDLICSHCADELPPGLVWCPRDGARLVPKVGLIGRGVGRYVIVGELGTGGMGTVYRAIQRTIGARVAIKIMHAGREYQSWASMTRFFNEACAAAQLPHDNIVKVLDYGQIEEGRAYLVMEHLHGAPLSEIINGYAPLEYRAVAALMEQVLDAVATAHDHGIVHRDLKPGNLFVTRGMRAVLLDFGIAKVQDTSSTIDLTVVGAPVGTPSYMAPEQVLGDLVDSRADLYSVGAVLYHALAGTEPFATETGCNLAVMTMQLDKVPVPLRQLRPDIPQAFEEVVMTALAKSPDQRYPSARAMKAALANARGAAADDSLLPLPHWPPLDVPRPGEPELLRRRPPPMTDTDAGLEDTVVDYELPWRDETPASLTPVPQPPIAAEPSSQS